MPIIIDNGTPAIVGAAAFGAGLGQGRAQLMQQWMPYARQAQAQKFEAGQADLARLSAKGMLRAKLQNEADMQRERLGVDWNKNMEFVPGPAGTPLPDKEKRRRRAANAAADREGKPRPYPDPDAPVGGGTWRTRPQGPQLAPPGFDPLSALPAPNRPSLADTGLVGQQLPSMAEDYDSQYRQTLEEIQQNMGLYG